MAQSRGPSQAGGGEARSVPPGRPGEGRSERDAFSCKARRAED